MRRIRKTIGNLGINTALLLLTTTFSLTPIAEAQLEFFEEDFTGPLDTSVWVQNGNSNGHTGISEDSYVLTGQHGAGGTKLVRFQNGTLGSFRNEIEVIIDPFRLEANPGTQSDFKWKMFGPDGFMEVVLNSFGDMRLFHNDLDGGGGNIQPNTNIGIADGDRLRLVMDFDVDADMVEVTYSLNGGEVIPFYSGGGIDGPIGDIITNFVEVETFKWANDEPTEIVAGVDLWNLVDPVVPPEPTPFMITVIDYDPIADTFRFTWDSEPDKAYGIYWSFDLTNWDADIADGILSQGGSTTYPAPEEPAEPNPGTIEGVRPEAIFFLVRELP